jgi:predicted nucleic-acid-binding protein
MRAVDTNVLIRLITRDDAKQAAIADSFIAKGAWISHLVLAETIWVLTRVYDLSASEVAKAIEMLLNHASLSLQDADTVEAALGQYLKRPSVGFSDCLIVEIARKAGHTPLGTFDRNLSKLPGTERI